LETANGSQNNLHYVTNSTNVPIRSPNGVIQNNRGGIAKTCYPSTNTGCCKACAEHCHRGHELVKKESSAFFCDCGAGDPVIEGFTCKAMQGHEDDNCNCMAPLVELDDQLLPIEDDDDDNNTATDEVSDGDDEQLAAAAQENDEKRSKFAANRDATNCYEGWKP
jgi:hypothetical protein